MSGVPASGPRTQAAPPVLRFDAACKRRGGQPVLQGLDFAVGRGEIFGLLGPNGCGKTTALHIASQLLRADGGQVLIDGEPASPRSLPRLGLCPQQPALYRELRPAENLDFFARVYGVPAAARALHVHALMQRFGLEAFAATPAGRLSGGWQQRLNLAVALVHGPELLVLDEPTAAVDLGARHELWALIEGLRDGGMTLLMTTHDLAEAERLCTRVGLMQGGRLAACGTPAELCTRVPGRAVASLQTHDAAAARERAAHCGWPVRSWAGALACLLPEAPHAGTLREVVEAFEGIAISAVGVQPVGLAHAYLELMHADGVGA